MPDWSGGTRIGECLAAFVEHHAKRHVDPRTVVIILSDGLDRGDPARLAAAVREIHRRARKLVWLNPLLGDERYGRPRPGMKAALPFLDHFASAHNLEVAGAVAASPLGVIVRGVDQGRTGEGTLSGTWQTAPSAR